jgi:hyperosmotically inducible protein
MKPKFMISAALAAVLLVSGTVLAQDKNDKGKQSGAFDSSYRQGTFQVLPGTKQIINGGNRQQVQIAREVRHELAMLPYYSLFDDLRYSVDGSTVKLTGYVVRPSLKNDAANAVKGIEGVTNVVNNIEVLPPTSSDEQIRYAVARHIFSFGALSRYGWEAAPSIHILVKGGHVALEGVVDSQADKDAANIQANQVPGVFSVDNNLEVASRQQK